MSIVAYTGLPGHGKSYGVVENVIIPALKQGRRVVTNIPLERDLLVQTFGGVIHQLPHDATAAQMPELCVPGCVFVLDEVWRYWPSGLTGAKVPADQQEMFTMHRHKVGEDGYSTEIVLVTQDLSQVANFIRALVEQTFRVQKLTAIGSTKRFRVDVYEGAVTGAKPPVSKRLREIPGKYKPEIYQYYQSHTQSQSGGAGQEVKADSRGNILKSWRIVLAAVAVCALPLLIIPVWRFFHPKPKAAPVSTEALQATPPSKPLTAPPPPPPSYSKTWRYAGAVSVGKALRYIISSDMGERFLDWTDCHRDEARNVICKVDGEIVTAWTGTPPPVFNQWFSASASSPPQ